MFLYPVVVIRLNLIQLTFMIDTLWQGRRVSNSQHPVLETGALPIELRP